MYDYRKMSSEMRDYVLNRRKSQHLPWHSPPHREMGYSDRYIVSAACYEHQMFIGKSPDRMTECERDILLVCHSINCDLEAWCILPNHYHLLLRCEQIKSLCKELGKYHGRSSKKWNDEEYQRGRKVWFRCFDREIRSDRHFFASLNYIHYNPVRHGYVDKWNDWPWSSATEFLEKIGQAKAERIWLEYPILDYGKNWDVD